MNRNSDNQAVRSPRKTIVVVDDEKDIVELVSYNLQRNGYHVLPASDGEEAIQLINKHVPDLVLLDVMLPGVNGTEVARRLRADPKTAGVPIVMLTAKGEETDVVVGLTLGADDYITKPFSMKILLARVAAVLRGREAATTQESGEILTAGALLMDLAKHEATAAGEPVRLTLTEFKLLKALVEGRGRVLSRDQLMDKGMGQDVMITDRAIDVHVTSIRKKLGKHSYMVRTIRGVGYRITENPQDGIE